MRNRHSRLAILLAAVAAGGALAGLTVLRPPGGATAAPRQAEVQDRPPAAGPDHRADEEAVRKTCADYVAALSKGDADGILRFWAPDADYIDESGRMIRGRDAIATMLKQSLPELKGCQFTGHVDALKFLRPEIALTDGTLECTAADGSRDSNRYAVVWTKSGDRWLISSARDLPPSSADVPCPTAAQLQCLAWLVGEWREQGENPHARVVCRWAPNKSFLLMEYNVARPGEEPLQVRQRVGWDPQNGLIRSWVFDSTGGFGDAVWRRDGKRWVTDAEGVLPDGGTGTSTNVYEFVDTNTFVWRSTDREVDGQPMADAEIRFARQSSKEGGRP